MSLMTDYNPHFVKKVYCINCKFNKSGFGIEMLFSEKFAIMIENQLGIGLKNMAKDISISLGLIYKLDEYSLLKWNNKPAGNSTSKVMRGEVVN